MLEVQQGKCYYSGLPMTYAPGSAWKCSVERFDNGKGYEVFNCALICIEFNTTKQWSRDKVKYVISKQKDPDPPALFDETTFAKSDRPVQMKSFQITVQYIQYRLCRVCDRCRGINLFYSHRDRNTCMDCIKKLHSIYRKSWRGHLHLLIGHSKEGMKSKQEKQTAHLRTDFSVDIDFEFVKNLLIKQDGKCAYSGVLLKSGSGLEHDFVASIERIDNLRGYTQDNVCLICQEFNCGNSSMLAKNPIGGGSQWTKEKFQFFVQNHSLEQHPDAISSLAAEDIDMSTK
jgi:hypothetical protein